MAVTFPFTTKRLDSATCPEGKNRVYFQDSKSPLWLAVTQKGTKTFFVRRRVNGAEASRVKIGEHPTMSIDTARKEASKMVGKIVVGIDPQARKRELRAN